MRKILPYMAIVIAIALVSYRYYTITQPETVMMTRPISQKDMLSKTIFADMTWSTSGDISTQTGSYLDYTTSGVQQALDEGKRVILFFYASRDPTCRQLDQDIKTSINSFSSPVAIFKVDYDKDAALRDTYEVKIQYTLVEIDKDQKKINLAIAPSLKALLDFIK